MTAQSPISVLQDLEVFPRKRRSCRTREISMTMDHSKLYRALVDEAVLIVAGSPLVERPNLISKLALRYEQRFLETGMSPDMAATIINDAWLRDVLARLDEIDLASCGIAIGRC